MKDTLIGLALLSIPALVLLVGGPVALLVLIVGAGVLCTANLVGLIARLWWSDRRARRDF